MANRFYVDLEDPSLVISFLRKALNGAASLEDLCKELGSGAIDRDHEHELARALPSVCAIAADAVKFLEDRLVSEPAADQAPPALSIAAE